MDCAEKKTFYEGEDAVVECGAISNSQKIEPGGMEIIWTKVNSVALQVIRIKKLHW